MANISSLLQELRERIVDSDNASLEIRFRCVIPKLLQNHVLPSSSANEREVIAILKLLTYTVKKIPGVYFHGKASAVLPIICRILPFFAEPSFCSRHGIIFETLGSLLCLLCTGDRDAYRQFFQDVMGVVEDLLSIASIANNTSKPELEVSLKCFHESLSRISTDSTVLNEPTACNKPVDGFGIMINLTGLARQQLFATWMIKISGKCLTEGAIDVEGLINLPFVLAACKLLCYGDAALQMACFDLVCILRAVVSDDIIPSENMILSISAILSEVEDRCPVFRDTAYDASLGSCLQTINSSCADDVIELTATDIISVFSVSMQKTRSSELKAALCGAYVRIAEVCPPHIWKPESLIYTLCSPKPFYGLLECFQAVLSILDPDLVGETTIGVDSSVAPLSRTSGCESVRVGEKRPVQPINFLNVKRQKIDESKKLIPNSQNERKKEYAECIGSSLLSFIECLEPPGGKDGLEPEISLTALSMLCIVTCKHPRNFF